MSAGINVSIDAETMERAAALLANVPHGAERAAMNAINRGLSRVKTTAFRGVKEVYTVQSSALNSATTTQVQKASTGDLAGYVRFSGVKIPLYKFKVTPKRPGTGKTVKATMEKGGGGVYQSAFIAAMSKSSGHTGVFRREGKKRYPNSEYMGLSAAQMAGNEKASTKVQEESQELVNARLEHEIERLLNNYGG